jgi:subtilisin family serine protease
MPSYRPLFAAVLAGVVAMAPPAVADDSTQSASGTEPDDPAVSTVLVGFEPDADPSLVHRLAGLGDVVGAIDEIDVHVVGIVPGSVDTAIAVYEALPGVTYAEANAPLELHDAPNDPMLDDQYQLDHINALAGFHRYNDAVDAEPYAPNDGATLAILDSGIDLTHPEFDGKVVECASYLTGTGNRIDGVCQDNNFHGTYVAGIAAAIADNAEGIAGVGFDADLFAYQVCTMLCFTADSSAAMVDAAIRGADVANYSFGGSAPADTTRRAVQFANEQGMLQVSSAGNSGEDGADSVGWPAAFPEVVAVGATDQDFERAGFSSFGPEVEVVAPGVGILSTLPGGLYSDQFSGTSFSGPAVAGLGALLRNLGLDEAEARAAIVDGADPSVVGEDGFTDEFGHGMIDVDASVEIATAGADDDHPGRGRGPRPRG